MFGNTYVNISCNNIKTNPWKTENGARQGGCLSPLLFSYYINDIINEVSDMAVGCSIGGIRTNIICFADDMCLMAPGATSLQKILDAVSLRITSLCLTINVSKSAYIVFKKRVKDCYLPTTVSLYGQSLKRASVVKYLGVMLSEDLTINHDVDRATNSFLKQFNSMYAKFHYMDDKVLKFLFITYTSSFYGAELWYGSQIYKNINKVSVTYHKAVKKIAHLNVWDSNHVACEIVGVPIFKHLVAKRAVCFFHTLINSSSPCISPYRHYLRYHSYALNQLNILFLKNYEISQFMDNPLCAILSRIQFVQNNEPRRSQPSNNTPTNIPGS